MARNGAGSKVAPPPDHPGLDMETMVDCIAIIVAAGRGHRFGGELPKQYVDLDGVPVIRQTLTAFIEHASVDAVLPVIHEDDAALFAAAADGLAILEPVFGGASRQESVSNGLEALAEISPKLVLVHDAARPFVQTALVDRVIAALGEHDGAIPALSVSDTVKRVDADGAIVETVDRSALMRVQTPQGFRFDALLAAHRATVGEALTDDAAVAECAGLDVIVVDGDAANIKITTLDDLAPAGRGAAAALETRTGSGFDVHRFGPARPLMLCGVAVPHDRGLDGHSDADVGLHAITDAVLGAIGAGDIGDHFPPSDARWKGAASDVFLTHAASLVADDGGRIVNIDVTLICEAPRIGPHKQAMRERIGDILGIGAARVSVKGTTTEKLGFTGRGEGIAAQAMATVEMPRDW